MVKVRVDESLCMGHAMCQAYAPHVYSVDEDSGQNLMGEFEVDEERMSAVLGGLNACPERAIALLDGPAGG
jgi:ferredoxin